MTTRPKLEGTVLGPVDLNDQPALPYIFLIDTAAGGRQAFTVDYTYADAHTIWGERNQKVVIQVPLAASWTILHRDLVVFRTVEESIRRQHADGKAEYELVQSFVDPVAPVVMPVPVPHEDGTYR